MTQRFRNPGPATSARSTSGSSTTRGRELLRDLARRPARPRARSAARRSSRSRRARSPSAARAAPRCPASSGQRGLEPLQRATPSPAANMSSSSFSSGSVPIAISTSPASIRSSGFGVTSKVPSLFRSAMITAPVVLRTRSSRIVRPASRAVGRDLDLLEAKIRPGVPADELEERRHLRLERQLRHLGSRRGIRLHDAVGAGQHELPLRLASSRRARRSSGRAAASAPRA